MTLDEAFRGDSRRSRPSEPGHSGVMSSSSMTRVSWRPKASPEIAGSRGTFAGWLCRCADHQAPARLFLRRPPRGHKLVRSKAS
jgi:hypothetical protein